MRRSVNPYARVDYQSRIWACPFCLHNLFPRSYAGITETNLPAELFPTYSAVENSPPRKPASTTTPNASWTNGIGQGQQPSRSMSSASSFSSLASTVGGAGGGSYGELGPAFVVDASVAEDALRPLRSGLPLVIEHLSENSLVALITFDSMVRVYDLGFSECYKVVIFHGEFELPPEQVKTLIWDFGQSERKKKPFKLIQVDFGICN